MRGRKTASGYKLEVFLKDRTETHTISSALDAIRAAQSWHSRGVEAKVTELKTGRVVWHH